MIKEIVTHPGGAHKDDFLACSLMVAKYRVPVFRREPSEADLLDPQVCVIDPLGFEIPAAVNSTLLRTKHLSDLTFGNPLTSAFLTRAQGYILLSKRSINNCFITYL